MHPGSGEETFRRPRSTASEAHLDLRSVRQVTARVDVDGFTIWETAGRPFEGLVSHPHALPQIFIVYEGLVREYIGGRFLTFRRGATVLRPPGTIEFGIGGTAPARSLVIDVLPREYEKFLRLCPEGMGPLQMSPVIVRDIPFRILDEIRHPDRSSALALQGLLLQLLAIVGRASAAHPLPPWLERAIEIVESSYCQSLSLHDIATAVGKHPTAVAREYRRVVGATVGERIRTLRFEFAARVLVGSDEPLSTIAASAGYCDQAHLTREFTRHAGASPAEFRRRGGAMPAGVENASGEDSDIAAF
jgi:AraC family transcriptional regulator